MTATENCSQQADTECLLARLNAQLAADRQVCASARISGQLMKAYMAHQLRGFGRILAVVAVLAAAAALLHCSEKARLTVITHLRLAAVSTVLPLTDWLGLPSEVCLVLNPYHTPAFHLNTESCRRCSSLDRVVRLRAGPCRQADFIRDFVDAHQAAVIDAQVAGFPTLFASPLANSTVSHLADFYESLPSLLSMPLEGDPGAAAAAALAGLTDDGVCDLRHTLSASQPDLRSVKLLLRQLAIAAATPASGTGWAASWRHCHRETVRAFRRHLARPPCLPLSATLGTSHVLVWRDYPGHRPLYLPQRPEPNLLLLHQVTGTARIQLEPKNPCRGQCPSLQAIIRPGQLMVISNWHYEVTWLPLSMGDGFAVAVEADTVNFY